MLGGGKAPSASIDSRCMEFDGALSSTRPDGRVLEEVLTVSTGSIVWKDRDVEDRDLLVCRLLLEDSPT